MVKLRLRRMGRKKRPVYDIVATDSRMPRDGRFVEKVGQYNPLMEGNTVTILKRDRVMHWLRTGAQPTDTVRNLLSQEGLMLQLHMERKGKEEGEIAQAVEAHLEHQESKRAAAGTKKATKKAEAPAAEETTNTEVADQGVAVKQEEAAAEPQAETATEEREVVQESSATEESEARAADEPPTSINETPESETPEEGETKSE